MMYEKWKTRLWIIIHARKIKKICKKIIKYASTFYRLKLIFFCLNIRILSCHDFFNGFHVFPNLLISIWLCFAISFAKRVGRAVRLSVFLYGIHVYYSLNITHTPSGSVSFQCAHKSKKYLCEFCWSHLSFGCAVSSMICFYCGYPVQRRVSTVIYNTRMRTSVWLYIWRDTILSPSSKLN